MVNIEISQYFDFGLAFDGKLHLIYGNAVEILTSCEQYLQAGIVLAQS
jgi:hypothetical protein